MENQIEQTPSLETSPMSEIPQVVEPAPMGQIVMPGSGEPPAPQALKQNGLKIIIAVLILFLIIPYLFL